MCLVKVKLEIILFHLSIIIQVRFITELIISIINNLLLLKVITGLLVIKTVVLVESRKKSSADFFLVEDTKKFWNSFQHNNSRFLRVIDYHHTKGSFCSRFQRNNSRVIFFFGPLITITFCLILLRYNYVCLYFLVLQSFKNIFL